MEANISPTTSSFCIFITTLLTCHEAISYESIFIQKWMEIIINSGYILSYLLGGWEEEEVTRYTSLFNTFTEDDGGCNEM